MWFSLLSWLVVDFDYGCGYLIIVHWFVLVILGFRLFVYLIWVISICVLPGGCVCVLIAYVLFFIIVLFCYLIIVIVLL